MNTSSLTELEQQRDRLVAELKNEKIRHETEKSRIEGQLARTKENIQIRLAGLDLDTIKLAETVVFAGKWSRGGSDRQSVIDDAVADIATNDTGKLRTQYFGTKDYDRWVGQRSDHHYGYGPAHGSTVFSVGLREEARKRSLTPEESDAAIYYLRLLPRIQLERAAATAS